MPTLRIDSLAVLALAALGACGAETRASADEPADQKGWSAACHTALARAQAKLEALDGAFAGGVVEQVGVGTCMPQNGGSTSTLTSCSPIADGAAAGMQLRIGAAAVDHFAATSPDGDFFRAVIGRWFPARVDSGWTPSLGTPLRGPPWRFATRSVDHGTWMVIEARSSPRRERTFRRLAAKALDQCARAIRAAGK